MHPCNLTHHMGYFVNPLCIFQCLSGKEHKNVDWIEPELVLFVTFNTVQSNLVAASGATC